MTKGMSPAGFADDKAVVMAIAVVSARMRSVLVDAAAAYRSRDEYEVLTQLVRIVGVLNKMPLPNRSPQADMIATAVQQRATLEERQVCFCCCPCTLAFVMTDPILPRWNWFCHCTPG